MENELQQLLVKNKILNQKRVEEAQSIQNETGLSLLGVITGEGWVKDKDLSKILQQLTGRTVKVLKDEVIPADELFQLLEREFCRERSVLPLRLENGTLHLASSDPLNEGLIEEIQFLTEKQIQLYYASESRISNLLTGSSLGDSIEADQATTSGEGRIVQMVQGLILGALQKRASDIHIEPSLTEVAIRYRIDGVLVPIKTQKILREEHAALISRIKILSGLDISEKRLPQDGRILFKFQHQRDGLKEVDIRVSIMPSIRGEAAVLRILDRDALLINLGALGFGKSELTTIKSTLHRSHGMILASGPTGSGKTTSLYAMLAQINSPQTKILTIEDPVEYQIGGVEQIQAHPGIGLTFAEGLRSFLRHDPDVIMVGEIRDEETAEISIRAALTGHLVLSTIHTNDAPSSVTRLLDMGVKPYLVASTLSLVISQRLVRTLCKHCKKPKQVGRDRIREYGLSGLLQARSRTYEPKGCARCEFTGYTGRVAIYEIMNITPAIKQAIIDEKSAAEIRAIAVRQKMKTLVKAGIERVKKGVTTLEEVFRVAQEL